MSRQHTAVLSINIVLAFVFLVFSDRIQDPEGRVALTSGKEHSRLSPGEPLQLPTDPAGSTTIHTLNTFRNVSMFNGIEIGYWSDKLALVPYREYLSIGNRETWPRIAARLLSQSFGLAGKSPEETSGIITDAIRGGVSIFGQLRINPVRLERENLHAGLNTFLHVRCDLPEAPFLLLFSEKEGLQSGSDLPLTHMGIKACLRTDIDAVYHHEIDAGGMVSAVRKMTGGLIDVDRAYLASGVTLSLGTALLDISAIEGGVHLNADGTEMFADVKLKIRGCGIGIRVNDKPGFSTQKGFPVSGIGAGVSTGLIMRGTHASIVLGLEKFGPMVWKNMKEAEISLKTANISITELLRNDYDLFNPQGGGSVSELDTGDIIRDVSPKVYWLPALLKLVLEYRFDMYSGAESPWIVPDYLLPSLTCVHQFTSWPGMIAGPGVSFGNEIGFVGGMIPLRAGLSFGYGRKVFSSVSAGFNTNAVSLRVGFEATGTAYWYPRRGCTVFMDLATRWEKSDATVMDDGL